MPNSWIEKLKVFNAGGDVWAIPRKDTVEREMLNKGQRFTYKLPSMEPKVVEVAKPVEAPKPKPVEVVKPVEVAKPQEETIERKLISARKTLRDLEQSHDDIFKYQIKGIKRALSEQESKYIQKTLQEVPIPPKPHTKKTIDEYKKLMTKTISKLNKELSTFEEYENKVRELNKQINELEKQVENKKQSLKTPAELERDKYNEYKKEIEDEERNKRIMGKLYGSVNFASASDSRIEQMKEYVKNYEDKTKPKISNEITKSENWREKLGYKAPEYDERGNQTSSGINIYSQVPEDITVQEGFRWLDNKYGALYRTARDKVKQIADGEVDVSKMSDKERKAFRQLDFEDAKQMREFWEDVALADTTIGNYLHHNIGQKNISFTRPRRELRTFLNRK